MHFRKKGCNRAMGGVDLNRNFSVNFGKGDFMKEECTKNHRTYNGPSAFSEPETQAIKNFLTSKKDEVKMVLNFHSYGNDFIYPYSGDQAANTLGRD